MKTKLIGVTLAMIASAVLFAPSATAGCTIGSCAEITSTFASSSYVDADALHQASAGLGGEGSLSITGGWSDGCTMGIGETACTTSAGTSGPPPGCYSATASTIPKVGQPSADFEFMGCV